MQRKHNKKSKKLVAVVLVMMFCLIGCSKKAVSSEITSSVQTEAVSLSPKDMTVEEMLKHIKLYGEEVSLPCKVSELPKTVTLGEGYAMSSGIVFDLLYNGEKIGVVHLDDIKSDELRQISMSPEYENETVYTFTLDAAADGVDCFDIVGITGRDTKKDVLEKLGEPPIKGENVYTYESTNNGKLYGLTFLFDTDELMGLCIMRITDVGGKDERY